MGFRAVRFSFVPGREAAQTRGISVEAASAPLTAVVPLGLDASGNPANGLIGQLPLVDVHLVRAEVVGDTAPTVFLQWALEGDVQWATELASGSQAYLTNGGFLSLSDTTPRASGVIEPVPHLRLAGAALGVYGAMTPPTQVTGQIWYTHRWPLDRVSSWEFTEFLDDAIDIPPARGAVVDRLYTEATNAGQALLGTVNGTQVFCYGAAFAKPDPRGYIWTKPGDVGLGPNQIPPTVAANDPARYRFFPGFFALRGGPVQEIKSLGPVPSDAITTQPGSLPVVIVNRPPTHSRWLVGHDGTISDVIVAHPLGSDLRTPLQIFSAIWAFPTQPPIPTYTPTITGPNRTFAITGKISRQFTDFVRFIEPLDGTAAPIFAPVDQA